MFILSDQIIFPTDTFSRKQLIFRSHYKRNKYKLLEKQSCVSVWVCFAPTMPNVGLKQQQQKKKKKKRLRFWKKKNCWGRIPGFHLSDKKKVYLWMHRGGIGERHSDFSMVSMCLPVWKPVRIDWNWGIILECSRTYRNNAILSFDFIICQFEQFTMAIRLIFTHLIQMITYSVFKLYL